MRKKPITQRQPFAHEAPGHVADDEFGRIWVKESEGSIAQEKSLDGRYCSKFSSVI